MSRAWFFDAVWYRNYLVDVDLDVDLVDVDLPAVLLFFGLWQQFDMLASGSNLISWPPAVI